MKAPMITTKINWSRILEDFQPPLVFFACYTASEIGCIGAILYGIEQPMSLIKAGWVIGLLCGAVIMYFVTARPLKRSLKNYEALTDDMLAILQHQQQIIEDQNQNRRVEGDEWKDG